MNTKTILVWIKKHPFTAVCGGLCLLLLAGYFFRQGSVPEAEALLAQKSTESRRLKGNVTNSVSLKEHVTALEEANRNVEQRLVQANDLAKNQQYFYKIEAETGVKLTDLRPGGASPASATKPAAPAAKKHYAAVPYSCTVQGTYSQLLAFLRKLEGGEHFQRILTATVSMAGGADGATAADPILSLSVSIEFLGQS